MDGECVSLLPGVCEVLADADRSLPDDTSLEKLLDWFTEAGPSLLETCPCLLKFISTVLDNTASDPGVLSFALRLCGLLAADEAGFKTLQECSALDEIFRLQRWTETGLWEDPCIRIGWIQGLRSMLQHPKALGLFVHSGFIQPLLRLQTDSSLFIASAANQTLAHILLFFQPPSCETAESPEYAAVVTATSEHLRESVVPRGGGQLHQSLQTLRLLALVLGRASPPLRERLLQTLGGPLEELVAADARSQIIPAVMDVIVAALSSGPDDGAPHPSVARLLSSMLSPDMRPADLVRAAAAFLRGGRRDAVNTARAARILLLPLHVITNQTLLHDDEPADTMVQELKSKASCVSIVCVCLTNTPQIALMPPDVLPCPPPLIVRAVLSLLRICSGQASSSSSSSSAGRSSELLRNVTTSGKVQKSALDALVSLSGCPGAADAMEEVLTLLIEFLDHPDSDPTVLHKCYTAFLRWMTACSDRSRINEQLEQELHRVLRKRVCDPRWEVRDSSVEFLGLQAAHGAGAAPPPLGERHTTPLLREALQDPESYVRASAAAALGRTLTLGWQQGAALTQEQTAIVTRLLEILSDDSEGFARRAVVQFFTSWFSTQAPPSSSSLLAECVRGVLARGSSDLDWEVKVHTLELAQLLLERELAGQAGYKKVTEGAPSHPYAAVCERAATPHTHAASDAALSSLVEAGVLAALLSGVLDCDRPVALKACRLLIALRDAVCPPPPAAGAAAPIATATGVSCKVPGRGWGRELGRILKLGEEADFERGEEGGGGGGVCVGVCEALASLGLDERLAVLARSSDHVHNSPLSLLQDIVSAGADRRRTDSQQGQEEVIVDCY